jgi:hypothetical protein
VWKSVENVSVLPAGRAAERERLQAAICSLSGAGGSLQPLRVCSACAGDYEDPDRTAGTADAEEDESDDEFPAP